MPQVKILRGDFNGTKVYCKDDVNGKANVPDFWLAAYVDALKVIETFEKMVDEQYDQSKHQ